MNNVSYDVCLNTLSNKLRIEIIKTLQQKSASVQELSETLKAEQSRVSHALKALRECNFVIVKKEGKKRIYSLQRPTFDKNEKNGGDILTAIENHIHKNCNTNCCPKTKKGD